MVNLHVQWSSSGDELIVYMNPNNIYQCCLTKNSCYYKSNSVILAYWSKINNETQRELYTVTNNYLISMKHCQLQKIFSIVAI